MAERPLLFPDLNGLNRVLIVKLSAMGDVIHALPVSAALKTAFPHLELGWAVQAGFAPLVEGNPFLAFVHTLPPLKPNRLLSFSSRREYLASLKAIRDVEYDLVLDLQGLTKSAVVALGSRARYRLGYHWLRELAKAVETPLPRREGSVHIVDQYLDTAFFLGANVDRVTFPMASEPEVSREIGGLLTEGGLREGERFLSVNPASARALKQWGAGKFARVMDAVERKSGVKTVLVTSDRKVAAEVAAEAVLPFIDLSGQTTLKGLREILKRSAVHLCGDTGSAHLAAALGVPTVTLVGPTDPDRIGPYGQRENVLSHKSVCSPKCRWHHCAFPQARCLAEISEAEVAFRIGTLLETEKERSHVYSL